MDMNINTIKEIFGSVPVVHLPAAQALAKKHFQRNLIYAGIGLAIATAFYIGYQLGESKNTYDLKPPKKEGDDEVENKERTNSIPVKNKKSFSSLITPNKRSEEKNS